MADFEEYEMAENGPPRTPLGTRCSSRRIVCIFSIINDLTAVSVLIL
jgi:hypothetical protein